MTTTGDGNVSDLAEDSRTVEDLMQNLRRVQLYMIRMDMTRSVDSPLDYLAPHLREHILWLEAQEKNRCLVPLRRQHRGRPVGRQRHSHHQGAVSGGGGGHFQHRTVPSRRSPREHRARLDAE